MLSQNICVPYKEYGQIYDIWKKMKERCEKPTCKAFKHYGGRGITVCKAWHKYHTFKDWVLNVSNYAKGLYLDRINNDRGYMPSNCKFSTRSEQARNKRPEYMVFITAFGERKLAKEWSEDPRCVVSYDTLMQRIQKSKADPELSIITPSEQFCGCIIEAFGDRKSVNAWSKDKRCSVANNTIKARIAAGMSPEDAIMQPNDKHCYIEAFGEVKTIGKWTLDPRCTVSYQTLHSRIFKGGFSAERAITQPKKKWRGH
jgi:hypothetical protein